MWYDARSKVPEGKPMGTATLSERGQVVIPADIRARYELTPGTQVEFVDDNGSIRLLVHRRIAQTEAETGYGMVSLPKRGKARRLADFDPAKMCAKAVTQRRP